MKFVALFTTLLFITSLSIAGKLVIVVRDKTTGEPVPYCRVTSFQTMKQTDSIGRVEFELAKPPLSFTFACIGYDELHRTFFQTGKTHHVVYLQPKATELKQTIITGQSRPMLAQQSVYRVNTINSQQIFRRGAVTLNDVLNFENNNFISNDNLLGSSVSIGGISGQNVKILINGIALAGRENGNIDLGQINLQNIKRIEMIQGPMSVIYGSNAMGGVINLITNTPVRPWSFSIRTYLESIGKYNSALNLGFNKKKHIAQFTLARNFFQGWNPSDSNADRYMLWKPKTQYLSDLYYTYKIHPKLDLNYYGSYLKEKISNKGIPIINSQEGYAFDEYYRTNRIINSANATYRLDSNSTFAFMNSYTFYERNKNRYKKDLVSMKQIQTTNTGDQDSSRFHTLQFRGVYSEGGIKHTDLAVGYEITHEEAVSSKLAETTRPQTDAALFFSSLTRVKKWSVQPSARIAYNSLFQNAFTPALHIKYDANQALQVRGSIARGFRTPSLKELYLQFIDQNHTIIGNENLKPEIGYRSELSLTYTRQRTNSWNQFVVSGAYNDLRNMITLAVYNGHSVLRQYNNIDHYRNLLWNVSMNTHVKNITFRQGVGYIYVMEGQTVPEHQIVEYSGVFSVQIPKWNTGFNFNYKYNSKQPVLSTDNRFLFTDPIHIAHISAQRPFFNKSLMMQIGLKNLFNLQNTNLNGASDIQGNAHTSANGMYLFPERSFYIDLNYSF